MQARLCHFILFISRGKARVYQSGHMTYLFAVLLGINCGKFYFEILHRCLCIFVVPIESKYVIVITMCGGLTCAEKLPSHTEPMIDQSAREKNWKTRVHRVSLVHGKVGELWMKGFVEQMSFELGVEERRSDGWWKWWWSRWWTGVYEIRWEW